MAEKKEKLTLGTLTLGDKVDPKSQDKAGVAVEVKKKRTFKRGADGQLHSDNASTKTSVITPPEEGSGSQLTKTEKARRAEVLKQAKIEQQRKEKEEAEQKALEAIKLQEEKAEQEKLAKEKELAEAEKAVAKAAKTAEVKPKEKEPKQAKATEAKQAKVTKAKPKKEEDQLAKVEEMRLEAEAAASKAESGHVRKEDKKVKKHTTKTKSYDSEYGAANRYKQENRRGNNLRSFGEEENQKSRSLASMRRAREKQKKKAMGEVKEKVKVYKEVILPEVITVGELASRMSERAADVVKELMKLGVMATINQTIDADTAQLVVEEMGHTVQRVADADVEDILVFEEDDEANLQTRAPIVTVMGHVDHGKTSLLDALRKANVVDKEAGGITQHIGAYQVTLESGEKVTFIDTPGHAAFTEMRARGAKITDVVILIVAADDSVKPQTIEAIHHAQAAEVPIIVAINKIDLPAANPQKVKMDLLQHNVVLEEMGGDILHVEISAKSRIGLDDLLDTILLQTEVLDLKANPNRSARGAVVEARMEQGKGSVGTILVQTGTLKVGDIFVAGSEWGRVRAMLDDHGRKVKEAGPGVPVEILGLQGTPAAGDELVVVANESKAREISEYRVRKERAAKVAASSKSTLELLMEHMNQGEKVTLPVIIKGDVHGSIEAIVGVINKIETEDANIRVLHSGVGAISEADVTLASASDALIIGFNVRANPRAREQAKKDNVDIRYYSIIYEVVDELKQVLSGMLSPEIKEHFIGYAKIGEVFNIPKVGKVAGCIVTEGVVKRGAKVRLLRDNVVIHEGELSQLKRFKDDAKEVREGMECGMSFANYNDLQIDDMIECFEVEEIQRKV